MAEEFDPYRKWLGIPPKDQPPNHYRLLGIAPFEDDPDVIENAASRQMAHVRTFQAGKHGPISQRILNELTAAKLCLLQPAKKAAYDEGLRQQLAAAGQLSSAEGALEAAVEDVAPDYPPPPPADFRPAEGRWRTGNEQPFPLPPSPGPAPVPIPMPPAVPPPVGSLPSSPMVAVSSGRKSSYASSSRGRRQSSSMPMVLIFGAVGLLALAVIVAVMVAAKPPPPSNHTKNSHSSASHEKTGKRPTPSPPTTNFPIGSKERPQRPSPAPPKTPTQPISNPPSPSTPTPPAPAVGQDPRTELTKARQALAQRNDSDFVYHINQADYLVDQNKPANTDELKAEELHLREVNKLLSSFWSTVREGVDKKIPKGEKISFRRHSLEIVSKEGDQITYRFDDAEQVTSTKKLPPRVAMYIALRTFGQDNLDGKIAIVVFQLIDAEASTDQSSQRLAGRLLDDIEKAGASDNAVLARERGNAPKPMPPAGEDLDGPLILSTVPGASAISPDKPAGSTEPKKLNPDLVKEAREKFDKAFRERLLDAADKLAAKNTLLTEMLDQAGKEEGVEFKVKLLKDASELAAQLGMMEKIVAACDKVEELCGENSLDLQAQYFRRVNLDLPGKAKELLQFAQAGAVQAQTQGDLFRASELLKVAKQAADKAKLTADSQALEEKIQEVERARAGKK